ncbi:cytochrome c lysine N-methyltransferase [Martiniozyma asiatica (nom. inval.)]|nr:cytochrome c lysine N-methyltransferase [Martiniozyma asiatica]
MLFDSSVQNSKCLQEWVDKDLQIIYNDNLTIKDNKEGKGIGLFLNGEMKSLQQLELLRIPRAASLNVETLKQRLNHLKSEHQVIVKDIIRLICQLFGISETNLIFAYLVGFLKCAVESESLYLSILLNTTIGNFHKDDLSILEYFKDEFKGLALVDVAINDILDPKWKEVSLELDIPVEKLLQLMNAIRSRTLEIPAAASADAGENESLETPDRGDYYVDVSLVPILDFVNHDNIKLNAHFDVDCDTGDILLIYDGPGNDQQDTDNLEIFISYSADVDIHSFFTNYGFIPLGGEKVVELPVLGYLQSADGKNDFEISERLMRLDLSPNVQFKMTNDREVTIIMEEYFSFFALKDGEFTDDVEDGDNDDDDDDESDAKEPSESISGKSICFKMYEAMSEKEFNSLEKQFVNYLHCYFELLIEKIDNFKAVAKEFERQPDAGPLNMLYLLEWYRQIASLFIKTVDSSGSTDHLFDYEDNEKWLSFRMPPILNFSSTNSKININFSELRLDD